VEKIELYFRLFFIVWTKSKMPSKNTSRKTKQVKQPMAAETKVETDDDWGSNILIKNTPTQTRKKKVVEKEPEVKPPVPEWEKVGMTEQEYKALQQRVAKQMLEWQLEKTKAAMVADLDSTAYWESRLETLERSRERYNKKRGWSAEDIQAVDEIDAEIRECEENIDRIEEWDEFEGEGVAAY
jgi:hypothetical protein